MTIPMKTNTMTLNPKKMKTTTRPLILTIRWMKVLEDGKKSYPALDDRLPELLQQLLLDLQCLRFKLLLAPAKFRPLKILTLHISILASNTRASKMPNSASKKPTEKKYVDLCKSSSFKIYLNIICYR